MEQAPIPIEPGLSLAQRLKAAADAWCRAHDSSLARLSRIVINDTKFFAALEGSRKGPSTATLEQFARFLADPANWPEVDIGMGGGVRIVPQEAIELAHVTGVSAVAAPSSTVELAQKDGGELAA